MWPGEIDARVNELLVGGGTGRDPLRALEALADADPTDRRIARAVRDLADRRSAEASTPPIVAGVRREELVRFDDHTVTWLGVDVASGHGRMVRVPRSDRTADPSVARALLRDGRALSAVLPVEIDPTAPALRLPLPHPPITDLPTARHLVGALSDLAAWRAAGLAAPPLGPLELRDADGRGSVCCLTLGDDPDEAVPTLYATLRPRALEVPATLDEAHERTRAAFAQQLTELFHALARQARSGVLKSRAARLYTAVTRLRDAVPPPAVRCAVGVEVVDSDGSTVRFDGDTLFAGGQLAPPVARRLLRAQASTLPGTGQAEAEAVGRWVAAALKLRTVSLLLEPSL
jgi:hypothetical protein